MDNEELKGTKIAIHDIVKTFIKLDDFDMTEDKGIKAKEEILRILSRPYLCIQKNCD